MIKQFYLFVLLFIHIAASAAPSPIAERGVLDLSSQQVEKLNIALEGEWEFYWKQFIEPGKFDSVMPDHFGKVPSYWTSYDEAIPGITGTGFATYRLKIILPRDSHDSLTLKIPVFDTSYELFLDGKKIARNGKTGMSEATSHPSYYPLMHSFKYTKDTMELVVHVSNFSHRRGGFWMNMSLGDSIFMQKKHEQKKIINYALLGILFGTFVLFLVFFMFERSRWSFLYFSLASLGMFLRLGNTGFYPGTIMIDQSWIWTVRMEYLGSFATLSFGALYLDRFFRSHIMHKIVVGNALFFVVLCIIVLFTQPIIFSFGVYFLLTFGILFLGYYILRSFSGMIRLKHPATAFFFSMLIILFAAVNDTLVSMSLSPFNSEYLLPLSFLLFILVQISILIDQWIKTYKEKISIHEKLENVNKNLEKIISKRTHELNQSNKELKQTLEMKEKVFSIIAHDLRSPIASLVQYSELMLEKFRDTENAKIITELQRLSTSSLDLIENLLHWGRQQRRNIQYQPEKVRIIETIDDLHMLMKYALDEKKITLNVEIPPELKAWCDRTLLHICLRNVLSNAIKFTPFHGNITVRSSTENKKVTITIQDSGVGIDKEQLDRILNDNVDSTPGTSGEKGTGLGLIVVREMTQINKGSFSMESKPGRGTSAKFTLPGKP